MKKTANGQRQAGKLRIIGGRWRGRKFSFAAEPGLRPTGDRQREMLFNWLSSDIDDARCADLFAGSGALGLEALSRGAACCDFIDTSRLAIKSIGEHLLTLGASNLAHCHHMQAQAYITSQAPASFHILFLDPPFGHDLLNQLCQLIEQQQLLVAGGLVYLESGKRQPVQVPARWQLHRDKISGEVKSQLFIVP